jgi:hypothetical protein
MIIQKKKASSIIGYFSKIAEISSTTKNNPVCPDS